MNHDESILTDNREVADKVNELRPSIQLNQNFTRRSETTSLPFAKRNSLFEPIKAKVEENKPFTIGRRSPVVHEGRLSNTRTIVDKPI